MIRPATLFSLSLFVISLLLTAGASAHKQRKGHHAAPPPPAPAVTSECPDGIDGISACPLEGCGSLGDALLNRAKNRFDAPNNPQSMSIASIEALHQPATWDTGSPRNSIANTEGKPVTIKGFVFAVRAESGESCNCELTRRVDTDVHIALVSDMEGEDEMDSITVEVTPRVRAHGHNDWVFKNLKDLEGEYVRVTGLLMLDSKHIPQAHFLPGERHNKGLKRATNWEVHPVTKLELCVKSKSSCDHNRPGAWESQ
jgi:hypothetical protein